MKKAIAALLFCGIALSLSAQAPKPRLGIGWFSAEENTAAEDADTVKSLAERQIVSSKKFTVISGAEFSRLGVRGFNAEYQSILKREHIDYVFTGSVKALTTGKELTIWITDNNGNNAAYAKRFAGNGAQEIYGAVTELVNEALAAMIRGGKLAYAVGDRGPAGGWIFYDKGNTSDGWRYLEAAPKEAEIEAEWGPEGYNFPNSLNGTAVGDGKKNTEAFMRIARDTSIKGWTAAQRCVNLRYGGYSDWFLPSRDELDLMCRNIRQKMIEEMEKENRGNIVYWSSSANRDYAAWSQELPNGRQYDIVGRTNKLSIRPVRQF